MTDFSHTWLRLREPVDHRSRNRDLARELQRTFAGQSSLSVVDLGCGTGSNLRATFHLLPGSQEWTLIDNDPALLNAAREALVDWADASEPVGDGLALKRNGKAMRVSLLQADLNGDGLEAHIAKADLVTAAALFDLCSQNFLDRIADAIAARRAVFFAALTYNGDQSWTPGHAADRELLAAFHAHQQTDKGFGPALGPTAPDALDRAFRTRSYRTMRGPSPWRLGPGEHDLLSELAAGFANACLETGVAEATIRLWLSSARTGAHIGHTDLLAIP